MSEPALLFVLGLPRSGTHLLRFALEKSPEVSFVPETAILYKYWGSRTLGRVFGRRFVARILARSMVTGHGDPTMTDFMHRENAISAAARAVPSLRSAREVLEAFIETPIRYVGEKSPNNTLHIRDAFASEDDSTDAKLILIQRDPYDQIASSVRTGHIGGGLITALARHHAYREALEGMDYYEVGYETLVTSPEPTLRGLCDHLKIAFCPEMLRPGVLDSSEGENFFQRGDFGFIPDSIGKGRERLGPKAVAEINAFLECGPSSLPILHRIAFHWRLVMIKKNQLLARLGLVMFKTIFKTRVLGSSAAQMSGRQG